MEKEKKNELFYLECVDNTFITYRNALFNCISQLTEHLKVASTFRSVDLEKIVALINLLYSQVTAVNKFIADYSKLKETV